MSMIYQTPHLDRLLERNVIDATVLILRSYLSVQHGRLIF